MLNWFRRKKKTEVLQKPEDDKAEGFLTVRSVVCLWNKNQNVIFETKEFIEELYGLFSPIERKYLEIEEHGKRFTLKELFLMKYGSRKLKYEKDRSIILSALLLKRGFFRKVSPEWSEYGTDEILDRFEGLFLKEE